MAGSPPAKQAKHEQNGCASPPAATAAADAVPPADAGSGVQSARAPSGRSMHSLVCYKDRYLVAFGGLNQEEDYLNDVHVRWTSCVLCDCVVYELMTEFSLCAHILVQYSKFILYPRATLSLGAQVYDTESNRWLRVALRPVEGAAGAAGAGVKLEEERRAMHAAGVLGDRLYILGGHSTRQGSRATHYLPTMRCFPHALVFHLDELH